ncbi:hypothetical protein ACC715_37115, partial [Rhizobium ruizarguesonis]
PISNRRMTCDQKPLITSWQIIYDYRKSKLRDFNSEVMSTKSAPPADCMRHSPRLESQSASLSDYRGFATRRTPCSVLLGLDP